MPRRPLPEGTSLTLPREELLEAVTNGRVMEEREVTPTSWRERIWLCPPETRLGVREVAEALGRPRSFVYRAVAARGSRRLTARRFGGELVFTAGELRAWLVQKELPITS